MRFVSASCPNAVGGGLQAFAARTPLLHDRGRPASAPNAEGDAGQNSHGCRRPVLGPIAGGGEAQAFAAGAPRLHDRMKRRQRGFTLVEVLVALAILAVALAAASRASAMMADSSSELRERLLAGWVAQNRLAELQARRAWPAAGTREGEAEQAGLKLTWRETVSTTPNQAFRRVEISVHATARDDHALARLTGYLARAEDK
jgi:general secretion pathway protein I